MIFTFHFLGNYASTLILTYTNLLGSSNQVLANLKPFRTLWKKDQSCKKCVQVTSNVRIYPWFFFKFLSFPMIISQLKSYFVPNILHSQKIYVTPTFCLCVIMFCYSTEWYKQKIRNCQIHDFVRKRWSRLKTYFAVSQIGIHDCVCCMHIDILWAGHICGFWQKTVSLSTANMEIGFAKAGIALYTYTCAAKTYTTIDFWLLKSKSCC